MPGEEFSQEDMIGLRRDLEAVKSQLCWKDHELEQSNDEIRSLKNRCQSYENELMASGSQSREYKTPLEEIGIKVRMRFLDQYRAYRKKEHIPRDMIKEGDRAAHRGRPLEDAWLYESSRRSDLETYKDLYGIPIHKVREWARVHEIVESCGFHGSLQNSGLMTSEFRVLFSEICTVGYMCITAEGFQKAFESDRRLQNNYDELQRCFDRISPKLRDHNLNKVS